MSLFDILTQPGILIGDPAASPSRQQIRAWEPDKAIAVLRALGLLADVVLADAAPPDALGLWFQRDQATAPKPQLGTNAPGVLRINIADGNGWVLPTTLNFATYLQKRTGLEGRVTALETTSPSDPDFSVVSRTSPVPGAPAVGDRYIVPAGAIGAWLGRDGELAVWTGTAWTFSVPAEGKLFWVDDENLLLGRTGAAFVLVGSPQVPAASQAEVDAGTEAAQYVSPATLAGTQRAKGASAVAAGAQSIADNTPTYINEWTFGVVDDFGSAMTADRFTVPAGQGGWYAISAYWSAGGAPTPTIEIHVNGSRLAAERDSGSGTNNFSINASVMAKLAAGDIVQVLVAQDSTVARVTSNARFACVRLA